AGLCGRGSHLAVPAGDFVRGVDGGLRAPEARAFGMAELICECHKRLGGGFLLDAALRLPLECARVTVLFGASGSGKTTLLRLLAGLERPDAGVIQFGTVVWHDSVQRIHVPPEMRRAGFLFQDYALFPHLTVARNVGFAAPAESARKIMEQFGLTEFAGRYP